MPGSTMNDPQQTTVREYEALATVRDSLIIHRDEIRENLGRDPEYLSEALRCVSALTKMAAKDVFQ